MNPPVAWRKPLYVVNEFPKSGGTCGQIPAPGCPFFPRNRFVFMPLDHVRPTHSPFGMMNAVVAARWRDVIRFITSVFPHEYNDEQVRQARKEPLRRLRRRIAGNLPAFIERGLQSSPRAPRFTWSDSRRWHGREEMPSTSAAEDLRRDPAGSSYRMVSGAYWQPDKPGGRTRSSMSSPSRSSVGRKTPAARTRGASAQGVSSGMKERFSLSRPVSVL